MGPIRSKIVEKGPKLGCCQVLKSMFRSKGAEFLHPHQQTIHQSCDLENWETQEAKISVCMFVTKDIKLNSMN